MIVGYCAEQLGRLSLSFLRCTISQPKLPRLVIRAAATPILAFAVAGLCAQTPASESKRDGKRDDKRDDRPCQRTDSTSPSPSQEQSQPGNAGKKPGASTEEGCASQSTDDSQGKQTNRILWAVPNFAAVSANNTLPPLSANGTFWCAPQDHFHYTGFVWAEIRSGQDFATKAYPQFGQGIAG